MHFIRLCKNALASFKATVKMKKTMILIAAFMAIATFSKAQDKTDFRDKINFGLKAGLNLSNVYDTKGEQFDASAKFGFTGGAFVSIPLGTYIGVQPEILYSQKGIISSEMPTVDFTS